MIFNISTIKTAFQSLIGFKQSVNPKFTRLNSILTTSSSGIYINDGTIPYMNLEVLNDMMPNVANFEFLEWDLLTTYLTGNRIKYTFPTYSAATTYANGQRVQLNGIGYESLSVANNNNNPETDRTKWKVINETYGIYDAITNILANLNKQPDLFPLFWSEVVLLNEFLTEKIESAVNYVLDATTKQDNVILEQKDLYYGDADGSKTIINIPDKIVGYRIDFIDKQNKRVKFNKIVLQFSQPVTDLEIFLYNQNTKITSQKFTTTSNDAVVFDLTDFDISASSKGNFYLFYKSNDLITVGSEAINNENMIAYNLSDFVRVYPFIADETIDLKLIQLNISNTRDSYIANLNFSIFPDITDFLVQNKIIFANAIKLQFAVNMYNQFLTNENLRTNNSERTINKELVNLNIYNIETTVDTLKRQLLQEIENIRLSVSKAQIDCVNLPNDKSLINYAYTL